MNLKMYVYIEKDHRCKISIVVNYKDDKTRVEIVNILHVFCVCKNSFDKSTRERKFRPV